MVDEGRTRIIVVLKSSASIPELHKLCRQHNWQPVLKKAADEVQAIEVPTDVLRQAMNILDNTPWVESSDVVIPGRLWPLGN